MPQIDPAQRLPRAISKAELARYLRSLADLHSDPRTGNPALAQALENLSRTLKAEKNIAPPSNGVSFDAQHLTSDEVMRRLDNIETPKSDLVFIAKERFSIPSSRLNKMPRKLVVDAILDALRHEQSLAIIANEAGKDARLRSS